MAERVPRSIGEIMSDAVALFRRDFKVFYLLTLPFTAVNLVLRESGSSALDVVHSLDPSNIDTAVLLRILAAVLGGLGFFLASQLVILLATAAGTALAAAAWEGRKPAINEAIAIVLRRGAAVLVSSLLFTVSLGLLLFPPAAVLGVAIGLSEPVFIIGAVVLAIGALAGMVFLFLRWSLSTQTATLEGRFGPAALTRSAELMASRGLPFFQGPKFRLSVLYLVVFAISGPLQSLFTLPRIIVAFVVMGWNITDGFPPLASMPLWFIIPFGLLEIATTTLLIPFIGILFTLFYYDLRVRYEGLDVLDAPPTPP